MDYKQRVETCSDLDFGEIVKALITLMEARVDTEREVI